MRGDGLAREEDDVWRHGGINGRESSKGQCISFCSEDGLVEDGGDDTESASEQFVPPTRYVAWLGPLSLDVRHLCDVCLVLGSDYRPSSGG